MILGFISFAVRSLCCFGIKYLVFLKRLYLGKGCWIRLWDLCDFKERILRFDT